MYFFLTICAYFLDKYFGEFQSIKHPVIFIGDLITFFEMRWYKDSILAGALLVVCVLGIVMFSSVFLLFLLSFLPTFLAFLLTSFIASMFIAHHMLRDAVAEIIDAKNKEEKIAMLVSRDTEDMSESDIYKAAIETYAENLSDGVIAPLLYLFFFGLGGLVLYKAINTMDSMVGYRNSRYEKFGKVAARLDDIVNFIPSRLSALLIMFLAKKRPLLDFYADGSLHESPNAGHPITAMALAVGVQLGGDTSYFGVIKHKPHFGRGKKQIEKEDVKKALAVF